MVQVVVVERPEMNAIVIKVPRNGHEVRKGWRELQTQLDGVAGVVPGIGHVFVPEWQWATGVKELWVGVEVEKLDGAAVPAGTETLILPAGKYARVHVKGGRDVMEQTYGELDAWFQTSGSERELQEGSYSFEANTLEPINPFDIPADEIDWFDYHIYAPIASHSKGDEAPKDTSDAERVLTLKNTFKQIVAENVDLSGSSFVCMKAEGLRFENVNLSGLKISDANLSGLEIDGAQLGGAYIHGIGLPPEGHPGYEPDAEQRPLRFESCHLNGSTFRQCQLVNVELTECDITGLKINGVDITELLKLHSGR